MTNDDFSPPNSNSNNKSLSDNDQKFNINQKMENREQKAENKTSIDKNQKQNTDNQQPTTNQPQTNQPQENKQQSTTNNTKSPTNPSLPTSEAKQKTYPPAQTINPHLNNQPTSSADKSTIIPRKTRLPKMLPAVIIVLLIFSTFAVSFFFFAGSRQPKTQSRASKPAPTISLLSPSLAITPTLNAQKQASPSSSAQSFGSLQPTITPSTSTPLPKPSQVYNNIHIHAVSNTFTPNNIEVELGQIVSLLITAEDKNYDLSIPDLSLYKQINQGQKDVIQFQAIQTGSFTFLCEKLCEGAQTARGTLVIK